MTAHFLGRHSAALPGWGRSQVLSAPAQVRELVQAQVLRASMLAPRHICTQSGIC